MREDILSYYAPTEEVGGAAEITDIVYFQIPGLKTVQFLLTSSVSRHSLKVLHFTP